ncbi:hypothetical protein EM20IM_03405 [Candidatus Methylacidiphilum infernorum]|uniref:Uncharacterized protein n=1 Tax=Candidatus Methylacidiphilum infernorum TaxID=511746 RepID=A0ABX7PWV7_9BACT|nr:hypothetical protein [Candidatus Methylacidiphilum infernorum]QSR87387.1 hypothetical protein EM20IM_03405 [Candidatus Methylacidiphilum infernorum]
MNTRSRFGAGRWSPIRSFLAARAVPAAVPVGKKASLSCDGGGAVQPVGLSITGRCTPR